MFVSLILLFRQMVGLWLWYAEKLPYSIRILLESAIRNCDEFQVTAKDVEKIIDWENTSPKLVEIPFKPSRVLLQVSLSHVFLVFMSKKLILVALLRWFYISIY